MSYKGREKSMDIIELVEAEVKRSSEEYRINSENHYDFWKEHIQYVYREASRLATEYEADLEIVKLGALLHDIALIQQVGDRKDHHINGEKIAREILTKFQYPCEKMERVLACVYNHRSSKNAKTIEEVCVADADILAHFSNIPMLFNSAYSRNHVGVSETREWMSKYFEKDYQDLSERTKKNFKEQYQTIRKIVLGDL